MSIPKRIFTVWLGPMPEQVGKWIETQKIPGYEHRLITLDNCFKDSKYMQECLNSPYPKQKWCKASDYLRMYYLKTEGGIYLDADVEILPGKNFKMMLDNKMFAGWEGNDWIGSAVVGAEPCFPFVDKWMDYVETRFRGDDDLCFESSMQILNHGRRTWQWPNKDFVVYSREYFYPYNHEDNTTYITDNTIAIHHFLKSWKSV